MQSPDGAPCAPTPSISSPSVGPSPSPSSADPPHTPSTPSSSSSPPPDLIGFKIFAQVQYLLSDLNLPFDYELLRASDEYFGIPVHCLLTKPSIRQLTHSLADIISALQLHINASSEINLVDGCSFYGNDHSWTVRRNRALPVPLTHVALGTLQSGPRLLNPRRRQNPQQRREFWQPPPVTTSSSQSTSASASSSSSGGNPHNAYRPQGSSPFTCQLCGCSFATARENALHFQSQLHRQMACCDLYTLYCEDGVWLPYSPGKGDPSYHFEGEGLTVLTLNVLFDHFHAEEIHSEIRYPLILDALRRSKADLIGLQEVTPDFVMLLMAQPWVQRHYFLSEVSSVGLQSYGQILLSRFPIIDPVLYRITRVKTFLFATLRIRGVDHAVCVCHLLSGRSTVADIHALRQAHLDVMFGELNRRAAHFLVLGDFNFGDHEGPYSLVGNDLWATLRQNPGFTFDVVRNTLAKVTMMEDTQSSRYDRILLHSTVLQAASIRLWGTNALALPAHIPIPANFTGPRRAWRTFLSDHYGLICELTSTF